MGGHMRHIISIGDFDRQEIDALLDHARQIDQKKYDKNILYGKILATLFFEPSTRTRMSFESAMARLGGRPFPSVALKPVLLPRVRHSQIRSGL